MKTNHLCILFLIIVLSTFLAACGPSSVTIYFTDGTTMICDRVQFGDQFTICTQRSTFYEWQNAYRSESVDHIKANMEEK